MLSFEAFWLALQQRRRIFERQMKLVVVACVFLFILSSLLPAALGILRLQDKKAVLQSENEKLRAGNQRLIKKAEGLESDPQYIEGVIRDDMNLLGPGEYKLEMED